MVEQIPPSSPVASSSSSDHWDVVVVGGGLAGKAASLQLAQAGMKVICISPPQGTRAPVGESLDWSAPDLLKSLGLPMDYLIANRMATWKRHVTLRMRDGCSEHYIPSDWLGKSPFNVELRTLHLDRVRIDEALLKLTLQAGVKLVPGRVVEVEKSGKRVIAVRTESGAKHSGSWFIDASGMGAVFARELRLPKIEDGPAKVALWTYFPVADPVDGTTLYMDPSPSDYLEWVWEIPVNPESVSVGLVTTGASIKAKRDFGLTLDDIHEQELAKFPRFDSLLKAGRMSGLNVTSFRSRVHLTVAGPNWLICGEAASMVDPITSNGVTAALRHAAEACSLILRYRRKGMLPGRVRLCYSSRIQQMARFFNRGIEQMVYEPPVRNRIGLQTAGTAYTSPAWSMNVVYSRLRPNGIVSTLLLNSLLGIFRLSAWIFYHLSRRTHRTRASGGECKLAA